jgi:hypothetical protein
LSRRMEVERYIEEKMMGLQADKVMKKNNEWK